MRISLKNIGKIDTADVDLDRITVIAGENDTGKSTVGRALFAVIQSFYHIDEKIWDARAQGIESVLNSMDRLTSLRKMSFTMSFHRKDIVRSILDKTNSLKEDENLTIDEFYLLFFPNGDDILHELSRDEAGHFFQKMKEYLKISDDDICKSILKRTLDTVFNHQASNIYTGDAGKIQMQIKDQKIKRSKDRDSYK